MKTLADIKRRVTPGTRLEVVEQTRRPVLVGTTRTIIRATGTRWYFTTDAEGFNDGTELDQPWPKARDTRIIDGDTFEYLVKPGPGTIRLRFLPPPTTEFPSLEAFYDDRPERRKSGEADFGVHWHADGKSWPEWRVSYVQATGEIYACEQWGPGRVRVLGVVPPDPDERYTKDRVGGIRWSNLGSREGGTYYRTLDGILDGWADPDISGHDLAWIEQKLAAARSA